VSGGRRGGWGRAKIKRWAREAPRKERSEEGDEEGNPMIRQNGSQTDWEDRDIKVKD